MLFEIVLFQKTCFYVLKNIFKITKKSTREKRKTQKQELENTTFIFIQNFTNTKKEQQKSKSINIFQTNDII